MILKIVGARFHPAPDPVQDPDPKKNIIPQKLKSTRPSESDTPNLGESIENVKKKSKV